MRKKLLLILLHVGVLATISYAQNYLDQTTTWYFFNSYFDINEHKVYQHFSVDAEVIINDTLYYKMKTQEIDSLFNLNGDLTRVDSFEYSGPYLREGNSQFFIRYAEEEEETLLYDFDLSLGDTIPGGFIASETFSDSSIIVVEIDTLISGDLIRKRFLTNFPDIQLIEGVCNNRSWRMPEYPLDAGTTLADYPSTTICYSINGESIQIDSTRSCALSLTTSIDNLAEAQYSIKVYPNPASDFVELHIRPPVEEAVEIAIYNLRGQLLFLDRRSHFSQGQIITENLVNGSYLLTLRSVSGDLINTVKFTVQK